MNVNMVSNIKCQYYPNGSKSVEGLWYKGELKYGVKYDQDGCEIYEGQFKNGLFDGHGKEYKNNKLIYSGEFVKGIRCGLGNLYIYEKDTLIYIYDGLFNNGNLNGLGNILCPKRRKTIYQGHFLNSNPHGKGEKTLDDNTFVRGFWENGELKKGKIYQNDIKIYSGQLNNDAKKHGKGKIFFGKTSFSAKFKNDKIISYL